MTRQRSLSAALVCTLSSVGLLTGSCGGDGFHVDGDGETLLELPDAGGEPDTRADVRVRPRCIDDAECPVAQICVEGACVEGCRSDAACGPGHICREDLCVELVEGCQSDGECPNGYVCISSECVEDNDSCVNDGLEPNDTLGEASSLSVGIVEGVQICPADNDYYAFAAAAGETLSAAVRFSHAAGDLNLQLLDEAGAPRVRAESNDDDEELLYDFAEGGTFYLRVFGADVDVSNTYDLEFDLGTAPVCSVDTFEPNENQDAARQIGPSSFDGSVCAGDEDWFDLWLDYGETLNVTVTSSESVAMILYDWWGDSVASGSGAGDTRTLTYVSPWDDYVSLRIYSQGEGGTYHSQITVGGGAGVCTDDYEPNEQILEAATLEPGTFTGLSMCQDDEDYYAVHLERLETITATATFDPDATDIEMLLLAPNGNELDGSHGFTGVEEVSGLAEQAGMYYVRVYEYSSPYDASYTLNIDVQSAPDPPNCADAYEPNDSANAPATVAPGTVVTASACVDEDDFYAVEVVEAGSTLEIELGYEEFIGAAEVVLLAPDGTTELDRSSVNGATVRISDAAADTYIVKVASADGVATTYELQIRVISPPACADDLFEPNDSASQATLLTVGTSREGAVACISDSDYYEIRVETANVLLQVRADYIATFGGMSLEVLGSDGETLLRTADGIDGTVSLGVAVAMPQTVYARAYASEDAPTLYDISTSVSALSECQDAFEPNNTVATASPMTAGVYTQLSLCDGDDDNDYYALDLLPGDEVSVRMTFIDAMADLDLEALAPNGTTELDYSTSTGNSEDVAFTASLAGRYYIRAYHYSGDPNEYDMTIVIDRFICGDDANEDDDTVATARPILAGTHSATLCSGDLDVYALAAEPNKDMIAVLNFRDSEGDLSLRLLASDGVTELADSDGSNDREMVTTTTGDSTGVLYLEVGSTGLARGAYTLEVQYLPPSPSDLCHDAFEPNNTRDGAVVVPPGLVASVGLCGAGVDDVDWYAVSAMAADEIHVSLGSGVVGPDIDLRLFDTDGTTELASSTGPSSFEVVNFIVDHDGIYYIKVTHFRGVDAGYYFDLSIDPWAPPVCESDPREEDDGPARASYLEPGTYEGTACFHDEDWVAIGVPSPGTLRASIDFSNAAGDVDLYLYHPDATTVFRSATSSTLSNETIVQIVSVPGVYYLVVKAKGADQNSYRLDWSWTP